MTFTGFIVAFSMALITFYVNQRLHKMLNIKITINSLFDIYGEEEFIEDFEPTEAAKRLMDEIIIIEKMNDDNFYIQLELKYLRKLRLVYFKYKNKEEAIDEIKKIGFQKLGRSFIILAYLNIKLPYYEYFKLKENE